MNIQAIIHSRRRIDRPAVIVRLIEATGKDHRISQLEFGNASFTGYCNLTFHYRQRMASCEAERPFCNPLSLLTVPHLRQLAIIAQLIITFRLFHILNVHFGVIFAI